MIFQEGNRVIQTTTGRRGKITQAGITDAMIGSCSFSSPQYVVLFDSGTAKLIGQDVLKLETPVETYCSYCGQPIKES